MPSLIIAAFLLFSLCASSYAQEEVMCWPPQVVISESGVLNNGSTNEPVRVSKSLSISYLDATPGKNRFRYESNVSTYIEGEKASSVQTKTISYQKEPTLAYIFSWLNGNCLCYTSNQIGVVNCVAGNKSTDGDFTILSYNYTSSNGDNQMSFSGKYEIVPLPSFGNNTGKMVQYSGNVDAYFEWSSVYSVDFVDKTLQVQFSVNDQDFVVPPSWNCPTEDKCTPSDEATKMINPFDKTNIGRL